MDTPEPDDELHNPNPQRDRELDKAQTFYSSRGAANLGCLFLLIFGVLALLFVFLVRSHLALHTQLVFTVVVRALRLTMNPNQDTDNTHF